MKKVESCIVENCIGTPSSCVDWNGGDISFLGICNGESLNNVIAELTGKVEDLSKDSLSGFDIDPLLAICSQNEPLEINELSILNLLKSTQVCLKGYIDKLADQIQAIGSQNDVNANLKCFTVTDNLGNTLAVTRDSFDQLTIDNLCSQKSRIETLEGTIVNIQSQINNINSSNDETVVTCVNSSPLTISEQLINTSTAHCDLRSEFDDLETAIGTVSNISSALAKTPGDLNAEFGLITGWILTPSNLSQNYNNLLLEVENLRQRIKTIETTCCAASCDDVKLGFSAVYNEDNTGILIKFTAGAGTKIPAGFTDIGSTITITDIDGNVETYTTANPHLIANNAEIEITVVGLNLNGELTVNITANISNGSLTCSKCLGKTIKQSGCNYCEITATGSDGSSAVIIYEGTTSSVVIEASSTTTSTSTTTTTTLGV